MLSFYLPSRRFIYLGRGIVLSDFTVSVCFSDYDFFFWGGVYLLQGARQMRSL